MSIITNTDRNTSAETYTPTSVRENTWWGKLRGRNDDVILNPNLAPDRAQSHLNAANLALDVYEDSGAPAGFTRLSEDALSELGLDPSLFENSDTGFQAALYQNNTTGEYTLAFRGTDEAADWTNSNIPQSLGDQPESYAQALLLTDAVKNAVGDDAELNLVGHSMGGGLANFAAVYHDLDYTAFNAAGLSESLIDTLKTQGPYTGTGLIINDQHDPLTNHTGRFNDESYGGEHYGYSDIIWVENQQFSSVSLDPSERLNAHDPEANIIPYLSQEAGRADLELASKISRLASAFLKL